MNPKEAAASEPERADQELISIADMMLAKLQKEYWQVQQHNLVMPASQVECPEEEPNHEDYQVLGGDLDEPDHMSESEEQSQQHEKESAPKENFQQDETKQEKKEQQKDQKDKDLADIGQLMEVFPTEQWVPPQKEVNINAEKIKEMTLSMNLPLPEWMKDQNLLRNRVFELFGQKIK